MKILLVNTNQEKSKMSAPLGPCYIATSLKNEGYDTNEVRKTAEYLENVGLPACWLFLLGGPGETEDTVKETLDFARKYLSDKKNMVVFNTEIRVYPGTEMEKIAIAEGCPSQNHDLLTPYFYVSPAIDKKKMFSLINETIKCYPNFFHGGKSWVFKILVLAGSLLRTDPPYWKYASSVVSFSPVFFLRKWALKYIENGGSASG
jgi:hypothetical protein